MIKANLPGRFSPLESSFCLPVIITNIIKSLHSSNNVTSQTRISILLYISLSWMNTKWPRQTTSIHQYHTEISYQSFRPYIGEKQWHDFFVWKWIRHYIQMTTDTLRESRRCPQLKPWHRKEISFYFYPYLITQFGGRVLSISTYTPYTSYTLNRNNADLFRKIKV